jgi:hypothetical protein
LTDRDREVLENLGACEPGEWMRPMDVGGRDASHHSQTLAKLVARGLAESRPWGGAKRYRINDGGRAELSGVARALPSCKELLGRACRLARDVCTPGDTYAAGTRWRIQTTWRGTFELRAIDENGEPVASRGIRKVARSTFVLEEPGT